MTAPHDDVVRDRLLKVLRLAQQGVGGEKENAEAALDKLLRQHGLTRESLERSGEPRTTHWFRYKTDAERDLLRAIAHAVVGREAEFWLRPNSKARVRGIDVTTAERVQIEIMFDVYAPALHAALEDVCVAFQVKHRLYDARPREVETPPRTSAAERARLRQMADALKHVDAPVRRLASGASR